MHSDPPGPPTRTRNPWDKPPPRPRFRYNPTALTITLSLLLLLWLLVTIASVLSDFMQLDLIKSRRFDFDEIDENNERRVLIVVIQIVLGLIAFLLLLAWVYYANLNLRGFGAYGFRFTPGWAVGGFVIPVLSLWQPILVMQELWRASRQPRVWADQPVSLLIPIWWLLMLGTVVVDRFAAMLAKKAKFQEEEVNATQLFIAADFVLIVGILLTWWLVFRMTRMQKRWVSGKVADEYY